MAFSVVDMSRWDISDLQNERPYYICCSGSLQVDSSHLDSEISSRITARGSMKLVRLSDDLYDPLCNWNSADDRRYSWWSRCWGSYEALFNAIAETRWLVPESGPLEQLVKDWTPLPGPH